MIRPKSTRTTIRSSLAGVQKRTKGTVLKRAGKRPMIDKDHYETLMVHPKAERIVIEAAYRRLAREYHPDVYKGPDAHGRMVALNEAWEVLGDLAKRSEYDKSRTVTTPGTTRRSQTRTSEPRKEPESRKPSARRPSPPNPRDFGIEAFYWERASEGAKAWKKRRKMIPELAQGIIFLLFAGAGTAVSVFASAPELEPIKAVAGFGWLAGIAVGYGLGAGIQQRHDEHLLRTEFNPRYNPDPDGYSKYALGCAEYEAEIANVHITRTGSCYHYRNGGCGGNYGTVELPRFEAKARGYASCSRCGNFTMQPKLLPPPFGYGSITSE